MSQRKSIKQRLASTSSPAVKKEILTDWAKNWRHEQTQLISQLQDAIQNHDRRLLSSVLDQLDAVTRKRFTGLFGIIEVITDAH